MVIPTIMAASIPVMTGIKLRRTKSTGLTPATPASATTPKAQAVRQPPPLKIAPTWAKAANTDTSSPIGVPRAAASEPANGKPEKPDPSKPVITPTNVMPKARGIFPKGRVAAKAEPRSNRYPGAPLPRINGAIFGEPR